MWWWRGAGDVVVEGAGEVVRWWWRGRVRW